MAETRVVGQCEKCGNDVTWRENFAEATVPGGKKYVQHFEKDCPAAPWNPPLTLEQFIEQESWVNDQYGEQVVSTTSLRTWVEQRDALVAKVIAAWNVPGPSPQAHDIAQRQLLRDWPTLAEEAAEALAARFR